MNDDYPAGDYQFTMPTLRRSPWIDLINQERVSLPPGWIPNPAYDDAELELEVHGPAVAPRMIMQSDGSWVPAPPVGLGRLVHDINNSIREMEQAEPERGYIDQHGNYVSHNPDGVAGLDVSVNPDYTTPRTPEVPITRTSLEELAARYTGPWFGGTMTGRWAGPTEEELDEHQRNREALRRRIREGEFGYMEYRSPDGQNFSRTPRTTIGLEPDPDCANGNNFCWHGQHHPPHPIEVPPGQRYRHVCPNCLTVQYVHPQPPAATSTSSQ